MPTTVPTTPPRAPDRSPPDVTAAVVAITDGARAEVRRVAGVLAVVGLLAVAAACWCACEVREMREQIQATWRMETR